PKALDWDSEIEHSRFVSPILWLDENHLALRTRNKEASQFENQDFRWTLVSQDGKPVRELTAHVPRGKDKQDLKFPLGVHRGALLMISDGKLWRLAQDGAAQNVSQGLGSEV